MSETKSITIARGTVTAVLTCAVFVFLVSASAAAPICGWKDNSLCVEVVPSNDPAFVTFFIHKRQGGANSYRVWPLIENRPRTVKGGEVISVRRGAKSTWVTIEHCYAHALGIPVCTIPDEFKLTGDFTPKKAEQNVDRHGSDYRRFEIPIRRYQSCLEACQADGKCKAYTYVWPGVQGPKSVCYLKDSVPAKTPNRCCVSGHIRQ